MGVRSLQTYLEQACPSAIPTKSIKELAEIRRESDQELIIAVDALTFIGSRYGDLKLEWIGGAQLNQFAEITQEFVKAFRNIGIKLVFFLDGPKVQKKRNTWVQRRMDTLTKIYYVFDEISYGALSKSIPYKEYFVLPGGMGQHSRLIFEVLCGCEVHQSVSECDEEIAEYAKRNNIFGLLAHDTDYVIMDIGQALYLDLHHLDINTMTTRVYYPEQLARQLGLQRSQLPLLATLMGTDFIRFDDSRTFHFSYAGTRKPTVLVPLLANLAKKLSTMSQADMATAVAKYVLNDSSRADEIKDSIDSYNTETRAVHAHPADPPPEEDTEATWTWLLAESRQRHLNNHQPDSVYAIMNGGPFESGNSYEDYRLDDLPTFARVTRKVRQQLYGILLQQKPRGPHEVEEWIMAGPGSLDGPRYNRAVFPDPPHPGLVALWGQDDSFDDDRWSLFVHSVSPRLDVKTVRFLAPRLIIPTLIVYTIFHLEGGDWLQPWEVDVALAVAAVLPHYSPRQLADLPSDPLSTRSIRVSNLIMRSTFVYYNLLAACGSPVAPRDTAPWTFFDGKLFQSKYREARAKRSHADLCDNREDSLEEFNRARRIVFGD